MIQQTAMTEFTPPSDDPRPARVSAPRDMPQDDKAEATALADPAELITGPIRAPDPITLPRSTLLKIKLKTGIKRGALQVAARLFPKQTAAFLARRYLCSSHGFLDELNGGKHRFDVIRPLPRIALLRHRGSSLPKDAPRVLVVPGHDGHYRQFTRILRSLSQQGCAADLLVLPGHMHANQTVCSMRDMVEAIEAAVSTEGPYDGLVAHCVTSNAALFALDQGLTCPKVVLISTPLDLPRLVRFGGEQYGLTGRCLDLFVEHVSTLGAPYLLDTPWRPIAAERCEDLLVIHAQDDYAAPVGDVRTFEKICAKAEVAVFESGGHNSILNSKAAVARIGAFFARD